MPASEARIRANQANALKSTGPRTAEGKEASRANALKHGLAAMTVLPEIEAEEVKRRSDAFELELDPSGEVGVALVRRAATLSVRMERCVEQENAALADRVRRALADFEAPEGADEAEVARLRDEAGRRAMFDPSREATLARRYEAAAERGFFRALKELRLVEKAARAAGEESRALEYPESLASFGDGEMTDDEFDALGLDEPLPPPRKPAEGPARADLADFGGRVDVPFTIGRRR